MPPAAAPPWLSLPEYLTELILERLPLSDYVRFPAVCRRWQSIQIEHRRRHAPSPPPMLNLPWLIPSGSDEETVSCYSPFEGRAYRIKIPDNCHYRFPNAGWIFCYDSIFNPISNIRIPFPRPLDHRYIDSVAVSPPPGLVVFVLNIMADLFFFRLGDPRWTKLPLHLSDTFSGAVTLGGRLYCTSSPDYDPSTDNLLMFDPLPTPPTVLSYQMADLAKIFPEVASGNWQHPTLLVEAEGGLLMLKHSENGPIHVLRQAGFVQENVDEGGKPRRSSAYPL